MKLIVSQENSAVTFEIEVQATENVELIKTRISAKKGLNYNSIDLYVFGELIRDSKLTIKKLELNENDLISYQVKYHRTITDPLREDALMLIQRAQKDPEYLEKVIVEDHEFAELLVSENADLVKEALESKRNLKNSSGLLNKRQNNQNLQHNNPILQNSNVFNPQNSGLQGQQTYWSNQNYSRQAQHISNNFQNYPNQVQQGTTPYHNNNTPLNLNSAFDPEAQKKIEAHIRQERLNQLQNNAFENYPELFIPTQMLFIMGKVGKIPVEIFVDTGAQVTIISRAFAEKSNLMKDVDVRKSGIVKGVGTQTSLGKMYMLELFIEERCFILSATVLENFDHDILLGLDMMKRHRCVIDLFKNEISFGHEQVSAKFLNDNQMALVKDRKVSENCVKLQEILGINLVDALKLLQESGLDIQKAVETFKSKK